MIAMKDVGVSQCLREHHVIKEWKMQLPTAVADIVIRGFDVLKKSISYG